MPRRTGRVESMLVERTITRDEQWLPEASLRDSHPCRTSTKIYLPFIVKNQTKQSGCNKLLACIFLEYEKSDPVFLSPSRHSKRQRQGFWSSLFNTIKCSLFSLLNKELHRQAYPSLHKKARGSIRVHFRGQIKIRIFIFPVKPT